MNTSQATENLYCGIDISGNTIDVCIQTTDGNFLSKTFENTQQGFKDLWKTTGLNFHFVMETTGVYHLPLCLFLEDKKAVYSVVNALQIKRFIQMHLERNKSDKKDAFARRPFISVNMASKIVQNPIKCLITSILNAKY